MPANNDLVSASYSVVEVHLASRTVQVVTRLKAEVVFSMKREVLKVTENGELKAAFVSVRGFSVLP